MNPLIESCSLLAFKGTDTPDDQADPPIDTNVDTTEGRGHGVGRQLLPPTGHEAGPDVYVPNGKSIGEERLDNRAQTGAAGHGPK